MLICVWFEQGRGAPRHLLNGGVTVSECWDVAHRLELLSHQSTDLPDGRRGGVELEDVSGNTVTIDPDDVAIIVAWPEPAGLDQDPTFDISAGATPARQHLYVAARALQWLGDLQWQGHVLSARAAAQQQAQVRSEAEQSAIRRVAGRLHVTGRIPEA